eukprot:TRINITY_DN3744_c0_g1_i1.p1 TRINITY_DN3744_c0_g1~~TRINITY_DN3744_c0_g1_i1.p1  ORF type:complete len:170 (-),score=24.91 TRINITY_DN3744_c0_g1_i1:207-716(-)
MTTHPQTPEHFINNIWIFDEHGRFIHCRKFNASEKADEHFRVEGRIGTLLVFEHCNLHGVWMTTLEVHCDDFRRLVEDNMRLYNVSGVYNKTHYPDAFKDLVDLHIPTVTISDDKTSGVVTLAKHPMVEEHRITDIWVFDQRGNQIACDRLQAGNAAELSLIFLPYVNH